MLSIQRENRKSIIVGIGLSVAAGLVCAVPVPSLAQSAPSAGKAEIAPYRLAAEDGLSINVINFMNLSVPTLVVPPDGKITVPLLEPIDVVGKTTDELARVLTDKWKKFVINPSVTVSLSSKRKENVLFYGFVGKIGTLEYRPTLHLMEALAEAGGSLQTGDLKHVTLTRKGGEKVTFDLSKPETRGGTDVDILLQPGDVVYIPERHTQISVLGEVSKPGAMDYRDDMTVLEAITMAGGVKETADLPGASLVHDGKESKLDLDAMLRHANLEQNVKLSAGDRIMVPEFQNRTYIFGAIAKPGYYPYKAGDRLLDALNSGGGPVRDANLSKINVVRVDKANNKADVKEVDIEKALKSGKMEGNLALQPGDYIYIPDKKRKLGLDDVFRAVGALSGLDSVARIFTLGVGR